MPKSNLASRELKDNVPHNTCQIYIKPHLQHTDDARMSNLASGQMCTRSRSSWLVWQMSAKVKLVLSGGMHVSKSLNLPALSGQMCQVLVKQWLNLGRCANSSNLATSRGKRCANSQTLWRVGSNVPKPPCNFARVGRCDRKSRLGEWA